MVKRKIDDIAADYAASGFGRELRPGAVPALLMVDWARAYFDHDSPLYAGVEAERDVAVRLTEDARAGGYPVVFTRVEYVPDDPARDGGHFYRKVGALRCFDRGNPLGDFTPTSSEENVPVPRPGRNAAPPTTNSCSRWHFTFNQFSDRSPR